ncbi:hypothetical protein M1N16_00030 [Nitrospinaceae bacterium]|nr:hypothetical protein [Nitrospinaceae bacterium]
MNNTNPTQEQNSTLQPITKNSVSDNEPPSTQEETPLEKHLDEQTIDLNELFPDADTDLNNLFPDYEVKRLLKNIMKNKKDMGLIKERLATENKTPKETKEGENTEDSSEPDKTD